MNVTARAQAPQAALDAIALSRLTALRKPNGGVRGIATGDVFRRLVSRALARAFSGELDEATRPFQFALQTRAGTDSLAAMLRAAVELDPRATVVSLDGRSAYDTISRATILAKLRDTVTSLLPFTRAMYARTSTYLWWDDEGRVHDIAQAEGVEQGDPLAPGLYALGQHDSLVAASASLRPDEQLAAFLDDLYVVTLPERAAPLLRVVTGEVERGAGVEANLGKTRVFNAEGEDAPPGVDVLGPDVWCGNLPLEQRGFVALGVPIGHPDFVKAQAANRLDAEADLLRQLVQLPDVQCAWLLLAFRAAPLVASAPQRAPKAASEEMAASDIPACRPSEGGRERPEPRQEATRSRKESVKQERCVAANLGFPLSAAGASAPGARHPLRSARPALCSNLARLPTAARGRALPVRPRALALAELLLRGSLAHTGSASAHAAQYAAGETRSAAKRPKPASLLPRRVLGGQASLQLPDRIVVTARSARQDVGLASDLMHVAMRRRLTALAPHGRSSRSRRSGFINEPGKNP